MFLNPAAAAAGCARPPCKGLLLVLVMNKCNGSVLDCGVELVGKFCGMVSSETWHFPALRVLFHRVYKGGLTLHGGVFLCAPCTFPFQCTVNGIPHELDLLQLIWVN